MIGTDHFNMFSYDVLPQWCVGRNEVFAGCGDNMPMCEVAGAPSLSNDIIGSLLRQGFEPAFSDGMRLDHSFMSPLKLVVPDLGIPVVPIFQNCITRPMPTLVRSFALGGALAHAIESSSSSARVLVIGSGGLSHWLGGPDHGRVSAEFDEMFLERFAARDVEWMTGMDDDTIESMAGNGGHEIRNWLTAQGCVSAGATEVLYYEPIQAWMVGAGVAQLDVSR
jgi:aromatic ring-opening dioxygenase catalytic subunit (LigB family)